MRYSAAEQPRVRSGKQMVAKGKANKSASNGWLLSVAKSRFYELTEYDRPGKGLKCLKGLQTRFYFSEQSTAFKIKVSVCHRSTSIINTVINRSCSSNFYFR